MPSPVHHCSIPYSEHVLDMRVASAFGVYFSRLIPKPSFASAFGENSDPITALCPCNGDREGRMMDFRKGHIVTLSSWWPRSNKDGSGRRPFCCGLLSARRSAEASSAGRRDTVTTAALASAPAFSRNSHDRPVGSRRPTVRRTHATSSVAAPEPLSMHGLDGTPNEAVGDASPVPQEPCSYVA